MHVLLEEIMKKLFAVMLAALMLLSCMIVAPAAEEGNTRVIITDCSVIDGWAGEPQSGVPDAEMNTELDEYPVVSFTYTGEIYNEGGWKNPVLGDGKTPTNGVKIHYRPAATETKEYDLTGMNYMVFDLYVSDPEPVKNVTFWLELTSSGRSDVEERCWKQTLAQYKGAPIEAGWNHIELDMSSSRSDYDFNITKWNFLRIFNSEGFNAGEGFTLAIKNFYFSATSVAAEQAKAAAQAILDLYAPIADIGTGSINADNYETVKAQLAAAVEAYNAADAKTQVAVDGQLDSSKIERNVTRALEKYEDELNQPAEPDTPDTPTPDLPTAEPDADDEPATDTPDTDAPATDTPATDTPATDAPATDTAEEKQDYTVYFIIGGAVLVVVVVIVIVLVAKKKK